MITSMTKVIREEEECSWDIISCYKCEADTRVGITYYYDVIDEYDDGDEEKVLRELDEICDVCGYGINRVFDRQTGVQIMEYSIEPDSED